MPQVRIDQKRVWVGKTPYALLSGELHYWRLSPPRWRDALRRIREMGLEIAASYVCWEYHEVAGGRFDFRGDSEPQRNLVAFLDLVAREKLWLIIRPGPYIYSEWVNGGIPAHAARYHRLHPDYQQAAEAYMAAVVEVLTPYLATHGGPIILLQAENEPDPWPHIYEAQLGLANEPGLFQTFLEQRYSAVSALNESWESKLDHFSQARAVTQPGIHQRGYLNRYLDFLRFRHWHTTETVRWTVQKYRELGVDVPIYVNAYTIYNIQNWRDLEQTCELAGADFYPSAEFHQTPDEHRQFLHMVRYLRSYSALPYIPEFQAGIWEGGQYSTGTLTPNHYRLACLSALLAGAAGWNWYMLVSRDNWLMSPVSEVGHTRPNLYEAFTDIVALFRQIDPPGLTKLTDTAVTVDVLHRTARIEDDSDAVLEALHKADIDYECFDVDTGQIARPLVFYAGGDWLSEAGQRRLLDYVAAGGHAVFFQHQPAQDNAFNALNLLDFYQPVSVLGAGYPQQLRVRLGDESVILSSPYFYVYNTVPGEPILAERAPDANPTGDELKLHTSLPVGEQYVIGYREMRGAGTITCLGVAPDPALVLAIHRWLGIPIASRARSPHVSTALFAREEGYILIAVNHGDEARHVVIDVNPDLFSEGAWTVCDLVGGEEQTTRLRETGCLTLHLPRKSGTAAEITSAIR